ncbi:MAG TPA: ferredoxin [Bacteroidetes bacterium]|nr:ferredoxin [Bacteroidota bacterium]
MAMPGTRLEENAPGRYYVTSDCNGCGICFSYAVLSFMYSNDSSYYYIYQQPADEREEQDIRKAMEVCPMNCIKDDGVADLQMPSM